MEEQDKSRYTERDKEIRRYKWMHNREDYTEWEKEIGAKKQKERNIHRKKKKTRKFFKNVKKKKNTQSTREN